MLTQKTIRNICKTDWKVIFKSVGITNYSMPVTAPGTTELLNFIQAIYKDGKVPIVNRLDNAIFQEIVFNQPNLYKIESLNITKSVKLENLSNENLAFLRLNKKLNEEEMTGGSKMKILTSRATVNKGVCNKISLMMKVEESTAENRFGIFNIFFNVTLDFEKNMLCIGYHKGNFEKYFNEPFQKIYEQLISWLESNLFNKLDIELGEYNDELLKTVVYNMYYELTKPIETKLEESLPENTNEYIEEFFKKIGIELKDKYLKQMHSIIFQDYGDQDSTEFKKDLYDEGWIFRFAFKDGDYTRATSRTEDQSPVYTSPIFWNLKELISSKNKLTDAGFVWVIGGNRVVEAKIGIHNKSFTAYLYSSSYNWGEERIEHIRRKIREYL